MAELKLPLLPRPKLRNHRVFCAVFDPTAGACDCGSPPKVYDGNEMHEYARQAVYEWESARGVMEVPATHKLAPLEPTPAMLEAAQAELKKLGWFPTFDFRAAYQSALSVLPAGVKVLPEAQPVKEWKAEAERLITDLEWARMRHSNADPHRGERIKAALLAHLGTYPAAGVKGPAPMHPDCTAPDCDCEPGIECAARGAARGVAVPQGDKP